jgi:hypothetical protein
MAAGVVTLLCIFIHNECENANNCTHTHTTFKLTLCARNIAERKEGRKKERMKERWIDRQTQALCLT